MSLKDFFIKLVTKELSPECKIAVTSSEVIESIKLSVTPVSIGTQVNLNCNIIELTKNVGIHIHYQLKVNDDSVSDMVPQRNSFTIMMQNARKTQLYLPTSLRSEGANRKLTLRSNLVDWIQSHSGGWSTQSYANTQGKQFIISLTETIWYIDICNYQKFEERSYHLPNLFLEFFGRANPKSYKQSRKIFDANELNLHCQALAPYATSSWMLMSNFDWLRDAFDSLIVTISKYVRFLQHQRDITALNHASETPIRTIDRSTTIKVHKQNVWVAPVNKAKYYHLEQLLTDLSPWKPVDIEEYLPIDPL